MRVHVRTRNRMHQSAIVLVRCVSESFSFRRHIGEDPGDEVAPITAGNRAYSVCAGDVIKFSNPKLKEPLKVLPSSGLRGSKFIPVSNFPAQ